MFMIKKESKSLQYYDVNNLYGWSMWGKLPVDNFTWIKDTSQLHENFIKRYNEESHKGYFLEVDVQYPEQLHDLHNNLPFLPEGLKIEKAKKLVVNSCDKNECYSHKKCKTGTKSWISFLKSSYSN